MMLALSMSASAQKMIAYCDLISFSTSNGFTKFIGCVDFGNNGANELLNDDGQKIKFNSDMDALNYMAQRGWTLQSTYVLPQNTYISGKTSGVHYILKKEIDDKNDYLNGLNISKATKSKEEKQIRKRNEKDDMY